MLSLIENVRRTLRIYRCTDKPIWNTESGWALPKAFPSEEEAAAYLMRTLIINWLMGIDRIYWYAWDNHNCSTLATTTSDTQGVTPARLAYNIAEGWLDGSMLDSCTEHGDLWVCVLRKGSSVMHIIWAAGRRVSYSIPPTWAVKTIYDWRGHVCQLQESLTVTEVPLELLSQSILPQ